MAASPTVRAMGPGVSWSAVIGITPQRLMRPTVGLIPTNMFWLDGLRIDPDVSVPTFAAQKLAAVPVPELDPPVGSAGLPPNPSRGSGRGSYGFMPNPPAPL